MFDSILSFGFLLFCLALGAVVFVIDRLATYGNFKHSKLWRDLILPVLPVLLGSMAPLLNLSIYPDSLHTTGDKVLFGLVAGFSSAAIVRLYKSFLKKKTQ